jgi:CDP-diacylglycerol--glycerol-3-phosphate 3-phosphatidyltransferase
MLTDLPNLLTLARIAACAIFGVAALTDYFDGRIARSRRQQSDLGQMLDPIADKLLVGAVLMTLVGHHRLSAAGLYPATVIMLREILVSGLREYLAGIRVSLPVARLAKWKTGFQMGALAVLLASRTTALDCCRVYDYYRLGLFNRRFAPRRPSAKLETVDGSAIALRRSVAENCRHSVESRSRYAMLAGNLCSPGTGRSSGNNRS